MKIRSQKIIGQNGKVREHFVNRFNAKGLIERAEFLDETGTINHKTLENTKTGTQERFGEDGNL